MGGYIISQSFHCTFHTEFYEKVISPQGFFLLQKNATAVYLLLETNVTIVPELAHLASGITEYFDTTAQNRIALAIFANILFRNFEDV